MKKKKGLMGAITDIPLALKGFPKNLKWEPKNVDEYEMCKRIGNAYLFIALIPLIIGIVLYAASMDIGMFVALAGMMAMVFVAYKKNHLKNDYEAKFTNLTCPDCRAMIAYDENVKYSVLNVSWSISAVKLPTKRGEEANTCPMNISVEGREETKVEITCKCQKCGKERTFIQTFCTGRCRKEQRDVDRRSADTLLAQFKNEVNAVCHAVFDEDERGTNTMGVNVFRYDLEESIIDHFKV